MQQDVSQLKNAVLYLRVSSEEQVENFMKEKFRDLGKTYADAEPSVRRVLLVSICPARLLWSYSDLSNREFISQYHAIFSVSGSDFALSEPDERYFEHLMQEYISIYN